VHSANHKLKQATVVMTIKRPEAGEEEDAAVLIAAAGGSSHITGEYEDNSSRDAYETEQEDNTDVAATVLSPTEGKEEGESERESSDREYCWRRHVRRPFSSLKFHEALLETRFPLLKNDDGALVHFGDEWSAFLYCGRQLGRVTIPGSDGQCGPSNGPQCRSCNSLQTNHKLEIMKLWFPSLNQKLLIAALRSRGGYVYAAGSYLESLATPSVDMKIAFPGSRPDYEGLPEPRYPVSKTDTESVVEFLDHSISFATAEMALRRNEHDLEQAITYLLEKDVEQVISATDEDSKQAKAYQRAIDEFQRERRQTMLETAMDNFIDPQALELGESVVPMNPKKGLENAACQGHGMILYDKNSVDNVYCTVCALAIGGSPYAGSHYCQQCQLCDGCIQAKVVYMCPKMRNGGHLHSCPLQTMKIGPDRKGYICDIEGEGCLHAQNHNLSYFCQDCNFDVCSVCMSKPAPINYHRRFGTVFEIVDDEDEEEVVEEVVEEVLLQVDEQEVEVQVSIASTNIEEDVGNEGEGSVAPTNDGVIVEVDEEVEQEIVFEQNTGTNEVAPTEEETPIEEEVNGLDPAYNADCEATPLVEETEMEVRGDEPSGPTFDRHERMAAWLWEGNPANQDSQATLIVGTGNVRTTARRPRRSHSSERNNANLLRHNRPETLLTTNFASALETYMKKVSPAASEVHHVEDLLHLAQGSGKSCPGDMICEAVGSGKTGIAGTYLLAQSYGPQRKREPFMKCFCGDAIDFQTAPDGAVGCLNGHGMHPSCAADHLLGGGMFILTHLIPTLCSILTVNLILYRRQLSHLPRAPVLSQGF
jgi:Tfp pilus assembly protein PilX